MLMNELLEKIKNGTELRQSVLELKMAVRDKQSGETLAKLLAGDFSVLLNLLRNEDPKVRKNAALVLGELEEPSLRDALWEAYQNERTLYVRADYLKALLHYDCAPYLEELRERMKRLDAADIPPDERKHYDGEQDAIKAILHKTAREEHKFRGYQKSVEIILLTNRAQREATVRQLPEAAQARMLAGGVRLRTERLKEILPLRTYTELLFPVPGLKLISGSPGNMARELMRSPMMRFLRETHESDGPFYFRLDIKSPMKPEQRTDLIKKLAKELETASKRRLLNAPGGYELEIRLIANKEGRFVPLLKLFTMKDDRFAYRKEWLPTSISPVNAALIMELSKDYLTDGARVLDPFCGAGTMLTERSFLGKTDALYGVDILEEAVEKARENAQRARRNIYYINRDFFDFTHEYLFDEIITNLPAQGKTRDADEVARLYRRFLDRAPQVLKKGGTMVVYAADYQPLKEALGAHADYRVLETFCINEREGSSAAVVRYLG